MPQLRESTVNHGCGLLVDIWNAPAVEKVADLTFHTGFVLRPPACLVTAIVHAIWKVKVVFEPFGKPNTWPAGLYSRGTRVMDGSQT